MNDPKLPKITSEEVCKARAKEARDDRFSDKMYKLMLWMAGDARSLEEAFGEGSFAYSGDPDLGDYPDIDPELGMEGLQNHGLVNSRINIQSVVYADPEFMFLVDDPLQREVNSAYVRDRWERGDWSGVFYEAGMEVEACGVSFVEVGIDTEGYLTIEHRSVLDCLWDRARRTPGEWRFFFLRNRMDVEEAFAKYGHCCTREELENIAVPMRFTSGVMPCAGFSFHDLKVVHEWSYWDNGTHRIFLGGINTPNSICLSYDDKLKYSKSGTGRNPFGVIPVVAWTDSWTPGVRRPVGKSETTWRTARMMNLLEEYQREIVLRGLPFAMISSSALTNEQIKSLEGARGSKDIGMVLLTDIKEAAGAVHKVAADEIPSSVLHSLNYYRDQLNSSTGVMDSQRGQPLPGERTALEVRTLNAAQGVQARHTRRQFSKFLKRLVTVARNIGALYDTGKTNLQLQSGEMDSDFFPLKSWLAAPMQVIVNENSLVYKSEDDLKRQRLEEFQAVDLPAIQAGVADAYKIFQDVYRQLGKDPDQRLKSQQQLVQEQQQAQQMQQMQAMMSSMGDTSGTNAPSNKAKAPQNGAA